MTVARLHLALNLKATAPVLAYRYIGAKSRAYTGPITAAHEATPLSLGALPFALGGSWDIAGQTTEHCVTEAGTQLVQIGCRGLGEPFEMFTIPPGSTPGAESLVSTSSATKRSSLPSMFGDLGGEWSITTPAIRAA